MAIEFSSGRQSPAPAAGRTRSAPRFTLGGERLGRTERAQFTERLALLLETGSPLHAALGALKEQMVGSPRLQAVVDGLMGAIVAGRPFSEACRQHPELFPESYCQLVAAGESGGFLAEVLQELVSMDEKAESLRSSLVAALSYPVFLSVFSVAVTAFILIWVFPKFGDLFQSIRGDLPWSTLMLLAISDQLRSHGLLILAALTGLIALARQRLRTPAGRLALDRLKLRLPLVRQLFIRIYLIQALRVLALSFERGVSAMDALLAVRDVVDNAVFRQFVLRLEQGVADGRGLAAGFRNVDFLPPMVYQMVSTGEQSGSLALVFGRMADYYERELSRLLAAFGRLVEPTMLLVMGLVVGTMVSSLILPIFKLARAVH